MHTKFVPAYNSDLIPGQAETQVLPQCSSIRKASLHKQVRCVLLLNQDQGQLNDARFPEPSALCRRKGQIPSNPLTYTHPQGRPMPGHNSDPDQRLSSSTAGLVEFLFRDDSATLFLSMRAGKP